MRLRRLWKGEVALDVAFWNYAVIGGIAVNLATSFSFLFFISLEMPVIAFIAGYGVSLPYNLIATIGVCRAAARADPASQKAKLYPLITLAGMLLLSVT
jgi:hypothetical protein